MINNGTMLTNIGRYWPTAGPQVTLYVPGSFLSTSQTNFIILIDFEGSSCTDSNCSVEFTDYPIINSKTELK